MFFLFFFFLTSLRVLFGYLTDVTVCEVLCALGNDIQLVPMTNDPSSTENNSYIIRVSPPARLVLGCWLSIVHGLPSKHDITGNTSLAPCDPHLLVSPALTQHRILENLTYDRRFASVSYPCAVSNHGVVFPMKYVLFCEQRKSMEDLSSGMNK